MLIRFNFHVFLFSYIPYPFLGLTLLKLKVEVIHRSRVLIINVDLYKRCGLDEGLLCSSYLIPFITFFGQLCLKLKVEVTVREFCELINAESYKRCELDLSSCASFLFHLLSLFYGLNSLFSMNL